MKLAIATSCLFALTLFADARSASAALLTQYDLTVGPNTNTDPADVVGLNVTASNFDVFLNGVLSTNVGSRGAGIDASSAFINRENTGASFTTLPDDYFSFSVTPVGTATITFDNITFDYSIQGSSVASYTYQLRSSVDSFGSVLGTVGVGGNSATAEDIALTGLGLQTVPVEFRFYFADPSNSPTGTIRHRIDNVVLNGEAALRAVPEPSTLILATLGLLGLGFFGRRRCREPGQCIGGSAGSVYTQSAPPATRLLPHQACGSGLLV